MIRADDSATLINNNNAPIFVVKKGGKLEVSKGITIKGSVTNKSNSATAVLNMGEFTLSGGIVKGGTLNKDLSAAINNKGIFNMTGGSVRNNEAKGAAIGSINYNINSGILGYTWNNNELPCVINISGTAAVENNKTDGSGAGIQIVGDTTLNMTGGSVSNNTARKLGGGIYLNSNFVNLKSGVIEDNSATLDVTNSTAGHGGGVYVSMVPKTLHIENALITKNSATDSGGGVWFCPTGSAQFLSKNSVAIIDNTAEKAGDDFVSLKNGSGNKYNLEKEMPVYLSNRILGGGRVEYYRDGGFFDTYGFDTGSVDDSIKRYSGDEKLSDRVNVDNMVGFIALKAKIDSADKQKAEQSAKLVIRNNKASQGGGIGSNGSVVTPELDTKNYKLDINKVWKESDFKESDIPESIDINVYLGDELFDKVQLTKKDGFKGVVMDPIFDTLRRQ